MTGSLFEYIKRVNRDSNHTALKKGLSGPVVSYRKLLNEVDRVSRFLPGQTVISTVLDNSIECVVCFLAIGLAGSLVAPLNPGYSESEFEFYLRKSPGGVIVPMSGFTAAESAAERLGIPIKYVECDPEGSVHFTPAPSTDSFRVIPKIVGPETHLILFTSGTTGEPKSVPLSHSNMISSLQNIVKTYSLGRDDVTLAVMPLFHIHGLMASLFATLGSGGTVILPSAGKFSAQSFFAELVGNQCTWFTAVPTMHHILLNTMDGRSLLRNHRLRFIRSCSSALAPALLHQIEAMYGGVQVLEAYAMTEACHQMTSNPMGGGGRKPGSVGVAQGTVLIAIFDPSNDSQIWSPNQRGEICVRGPNVTKGYLNNDGANKSAFTRSGFFRTGDEGYMDEGGFLTITGRLKELINKGGEKISPIEVDSTLLAHPAVLEAVAFAIPDAKYGEVVGAAVRLKSDTHVSESDLMRFVGSKLASFKVPSKIFLVSELPRTATGKIQRRLVAAKFISKSKL